MGYVEQSLLNGEEVQYRANLHWSQWIAPVFLCIVFLPLFGLGLLFLLVPFLRQKTTEMVVTNKRVIMKTGLVSRKTFEMNLSKVETINVNQGIFARMLDTGTIKIVGTGGSSEPFKFIDSPLQFRRAVAANEG